MFFRSFQQPTRWWFGSIAGACLLGWLAGSGPSLAQPAGPEANALQEQERLFKEAEQLRRQRKFPESIAAIVQALAREKTLMGETTHLALYFQEYLAGVQQQAKDHEAARASLTVAGAWQRQFLPAAAKTEAPKAKQVLERWEGRLALRRQVLGKEHPWIGLILIDLALAQEKAGRRASAEASLEEAIRVFNASRFESAPRPMTITPTDAYYHLDRLRASAPPLVSREFTAGLERALKCCTEAEQAERQKEAALAAKHWGEALSSVSRFQLGGYCLAEHLEMTKQARPVLDRYLSYCRREKDKQAVRAPSGGLFDKGAIFVHQRRLWLERRHPSLQPFFEVHAEVCQRLAGLTGQLRAGEPQDVDRVRERQALSRHKNVLEAEMGRRHAKLPQFQNQPVQYQLPPGTLLIDYQVYTYAPGAAAVGATTATGPAERRLGCFIYRARQKDVIYRELGLLPPIAAAIQQWRQNIQQRQGGFARGLVIEADAGNSGIPFPQGVLRKKLWEPLGPYLDKVEVVLIAADDVLASMPFGALPGSRVSS